MSGKAAKGIVGGDLWHLLSKALAYFVKHIHALAADNIGEAIWDAL